MRNFLRDLRIVFADVSFARRLAIVTFGVIVAFLELTGLGLMVPLLDRLSGPDSGDQLLTLGSFSTVQLTIVVLGAFTLRIIVAGLYQWWVLGVIHATETALLAKLLRKYFALPFERQLSGGASEVMRITRVSANRTTQGVGVGLVNLATEVPAVLAIASVIAFAAPTLALGIALFFLISGLIFQALVGHRSEALGNEFETRSGAEYRMLLNMTYKTREVLVRKALPGFLHAVLDNRADAAATARRLAMVRESARLYLDATFVAGLAIVLLTAGVLTGGADATASIGLLAVGAMRALPAVARILSSLNSIRGATGSLRATAAYLSEQSQADSRPTDAVLPDPIGDIEIRGVSYQYPGREEPAVRDVSFAIRTGSSTAVVGRSGAGKSTLVDLLLGLLHPQSGSITVGGVALTPATIPSWHDHISIVPQDVAVLEATIAENVVFGLAKNNRDEVREALERAQLLHEVETLPHRENTTIGTGGIRLSGGQIQRLAMARALYAKPSVLFLDEATSALDAETELAITEFLEALSGEVTTIVVAHRLSTVMRCDWVIYVRDGTVCHSGTFADLYQACSDFRRMVDVARLLDGSLEGESTGRDI